MIHHANKMVAAAAKLESHDPAAVSAVSRVRTRSEGKKKYPSGKGSNKPRQWKALGICYNHYYCPSVEAARTSSLQLSLVRFGGIHVLSRTAKHFKLQIGERRGGDISGLTQAASGCGHPRSCMAPHGQRRPQLR